VVTFDDVMDVAEEEATEDFHKGAAVAPLKNSYDNSGILGALPQADRLAGSIGSA